MARKERAASQTEGAAPDDGFDAKAYLQQGSWRDMDLGLDRTRALLAALGNPQDAYPIVHVAGTNGKGSTSAFIAGILQVAGYDTGLFTSPFILRFNERIQVNRVDISDGELDEVARAVRDAAASIDVHPTAFELITAVALEHFRRRGCDAVVLEVGLGGRLDATNVVVPAACAITSIAFDHMRILGDTLAQIAAEKAGIVKPGVPVVSYHQAPEAQAVIEDACRAAGSVLVSPRFGRIHVRQEGFSQVFSYDGIADVRLSLLGTYQPCNAVMAIEVARVLRTRGLAISDDAIKRGLETTRWSGRFELVAASPTTIVDGGHNEQGAAMLASSLRAYFPHRTVTFVAGMLKDKRYRDMVALVAPLAAKVYCVEPPEPERALPAADLAQEFVRAGVADAVACASIADGVHRARTEASPDDVVCCFGSLYSISEVMEALGSSRRDA